jgi:hypothetical protein
MPIIRSWYYELGDAVHIWHDPGSYRGPDDRRGVVECLEGRRDSTIGKLFEMWETALTQHLLDDLPVGAVNATKDEWMNVRRILGSSTRNRCQNQGCGENNRHDQE